MASIMKLYNWTQRFHWVQNCNLILWRNIKKQPIYPPKLAEVGHLMEPKECNYQTGQLFLHRVFGYRGMILFPWSARVYSRDISNPIKNTLQPTSAQPFCPSESLSGDSSDIEASTLDGTNPTMQHGTVTLETEDGVTSMIGVEGVVPSNCDEPRDKKGSVQTFYQVLIDSRDCPYIRAQTESVTFLGNQESNRSLYAIPGLDHVSHDDIMPYSSTDKQPLHHELFDKFLTYAPEREPSFVAQDTLKAWKDKNHPWLEMTDVHRETTESIRVTVIPFYMGVRETPVTSIYWWRYCIRLENLGELSVQLRERHWRIFSLSGTLETVRGRGVVGQEPVLSRQLPAFQYSSHVSLQSPSGHMWGTFRLEREDGFSFDCKIPPFSLESKPDKPSPTTTKPSKPHTSSSGSNFDMSSTTSEDADNSCKTKDDTD